MTSGHPTPHKPAELFRSDLISAMKLPDSTPMEPGSFLTIREQWRTEWEFGVQVCVSPGQIPEPKARCVDDRPGNSANFEMPSSKFTEADESKYPMYDLDELDLNWLDAVNQKRKFRALAGPSGLSEDTLREALITLETKCQQNMVRAIATEERLGIEYDEQTVCDVCQYHESEETNDMIFCDACNVCVHQACYGIASIPKGNWLCKPCTAGNNRQQCLLCSNKGGALKRVRPGNTNWCHLSCALWIPEIRLGNVDKMEPITNIEAVPLSRWNLLCCLCRKKEGACIQCSHPSCVTAYHVTCGFQQGLVMKSGIDVANSSVVHKSYCRKHSTRLSSPHPQSSHHVYSSPIKNRMTHHKPTQLVQLQETFYKYTSPEDLVLELKVSTKLATLVFNYWKLKRRSQHNRTLLSHLPIETSLESIKAELAAGDTRYDFKSDEDFMLIVHIRQNLEKARNLIYMAQRRERLKKQILYNQANSWDMEAEILKKELTDTNLSIDRSLEEAGNVNVEDEDELFMRQTRNSREADKSYTGENIHRPSTQAHSSSRGTLNDNSILENHAGGCNHVGFNEGSYHINISSTHKELVDNSKMESIRHFQACPINGSNTPSRQPSGFRDLPPSLPVSMATSKAQVESLVLRSGRGHSLRHRPYTVNHKTASEFT